MFKEDYEKQMTAIRTESEQALNVIASQFNDGKISQSEWKQTRDKVLDLSNQKRNELIQRREYDVDRAEEALMNKIVGANDDKDMARYRELYSKYGEKANDKNYLIKEYETSIKLNDVTAGKALASVAVEHGIKEIANDYGARDEAFTHAINEYRGFKQKWRAFDRKFSEYQCNHFAHVKEPRKSVEKYEAGYQLNEAGHRVPFFRDRIIYHKKG